MPHLRPPATRFLSVDRCCLHCVFSCSVIANSLRPFWTVACQASLSIGFFRQKSRSGLPFPFPGDRPDPGIEPRCPELQAGSLPSEPPGKPAKSQNPAKSQPYTCCAQPLSFLLLSLLRERDANTWVLHTERREESHSPTAKAAGRCLANSL